MTIQRNAQETGNALFLILIAVVLFAALSYAITQSNRGGGGAKSEVAAIGAAALTQYASSVQTGVTRLLVRGTVSQITDFKVSAPTAATYTTDTNKQIFHPDGGGVSWAPTDVNYLDPATKHLFPPYDEHGNWGFVVKAVTGIGTSAEDLVFAIFPIRKDICEVINMQNSGTKNIPVIAEALSGIAAQGGTITLPTDRSGQAAGCARVSDADIYGYYHVLMEE